MPQKKKKSKTSKFARMSDEERARYLQHRAEIELESKLRKQQLIALYMKNKLKREEAMSRLNNAKIDERMRLILRQNKCRELKEQAKTAQQAFFRKLKLKDCMIDELYNKLLLAELDHNRLQAAHMERMDDIMERSDRAMHFIKDMFDEQIRKMEENDLYELQMMELEMEEILMELKTVSFALNKNIEDTIRETETRCAIKLYDAECAYGESMSKLKTEMALQMEHLWQQIQDVITVYEDMTDTKKKQYEYLKDLDEKYRVEAALFPPLKISLEAEADRLRRDIQRLTRERKETVADLESQGRILQYRIYQLRKEMKLGHELNAIQLKKMASISTEAMKELDDFYTKVSKIHCLANHCSTLEPSCSELKKILYENLDEEKQKNLNMFEKLEYLRDKMLSIQDRNDLLKHERNTLVEENSRLRYLIRNYLDSLTSMPSIRTCSKA